jgi:beta-glucanase (GH16 family)
LVVLLVVAVVALLVDNRPQSTTPVGAGPATAALPRGDLPGWHQVFAAGFSTPAALGSFTTGPYRDRWSSYVNLPDTDRIGVYDPAKTLSVHNGVLDTYLHSQHGIALSAATVPRVNGSTRGQVYGRYSVRFRSDGVPGYGLAWLLWPDSNIWNNGEIDFAEGSTTGKITATDHCIGDPEKACFTTRTQATMSAWHIATVDWLPSGVTYYLDGHEIGHSTTSPHVPMHLVLQSGTQGVHPAASAAGHIQIDWVAIYSRS